MSCSPPEEAAGGSSIMMMCSVPGAARCRARNVAIAVAAHADDASRVQPQEQVTSQQGLGSVVPSLQPLPYGDAFTRRRR